MMLAGMLMTARRRRPKIVIAYVFGMLWLLDFGFCWSISRPIAHEIEHLDHI